MTERVPSPEATGNAGGSFEARVAAVALSRLLRGDQILGLASAPIRVRLQQKFAGSVLDDIVIDTEKPSGALQSIEYEVKRSLEVTPSNRDLTSVVSHVVAELQTDDGGAIAERARRFGIATRDTLHLAELDYVVKIAKVHDSAESFARVIANSAGTERRAALATLTAVVRGQFPEGADGAIIDDLTWRTARALHIWIIDAEPDSADVQAAIDRVADLTADVAEAGKVFRTLVTFAHEAAPGGASITLEMLRGHLDDQGHTLEATPRFQVAYRQLAHATATAADLRTATIGRELHLDRESLRRGVREAIDLHGTVLLTGKPGVGKSVMSRLVTSDLVDEGAVAIFLNLAGRTGNLSQLEQEIGVSLRDGLAGAPTGGIRVAVIDGAEQVQNDAGSLLTAVLDAIPTEAGSDPPWQILVTARADAANAIQDVLVQHHRGEPEPFAVGELDDDEITQIVDRFPRLAPINRNPRARALLLRRPYLVELIVRAGRSPRLPSALGEEDVLDIVSRRLIRLDDGALPGEGAHLARADIFRHLARDVIANKVPAELDRTDPVARAGLRKDDLISEHRNRWRFAHDVLADYAVAHRLLEPDAADLLRSAPKPRRLMTADRLRFQRVLADGLEQNDLPAAWEDVQTAAADIARRDGERWSDLPWEALLHLGDARGALGILTSQFLEDDGAGLETLMAVVDRRARLSTDAALPQSVDRALSGPVVDLLVSLGDRLPRRQIDRAAKLVYDHLGAPAPNPLEGLEHAVAVPDAVMAWAHSNPHGDTLDHVVAALAFCGGILEKRHDAYLVAAAHDHPDAIAPAVEHHAATPVLARTRPELLLRLASLYYLDHDLTFGPLPAMDEPTSPLSGMFMTFDDEGVRDHSYKSGSCGMLASPDCGPFAALLDVDPARGLQLIGAVVDVATASRERTAAGWTGRFGTDDRYEFTIALPGSSSRTFHGTEAAWMWHRRTATGAKPALSALMALRRWGVAQIKAGTSPGEVRDDVLSAGTSLAFVSVATSVLVDQIKLVDDELDPLLCHPAVWLLESHRTGLERGFALQIPEAHNLGWNMSGAALSLVLRAGPARQEELRLLGENLTANADELPATNVAVVSKWAAELDRSRLTFTPHSETEITIGVSYPQGLVDELQSGAADLTRETNIISAVWSATQIRDDLEGAQPDQAGDVYQALREVLESAPATSSPLQVYAPLDALGLTALAVILAAKAGHAVESAALQSAADFLLDAAAYCATARPPSRDDLSTSPAAGQRDNDLPSPDRLDRSAARALPMLLLDTDLRAAADVSIHDLRHALTDLAGSPVYEVQSLLRDGLIPGWRERCDSPGDTHQLIFTVASTMIASAGKAWIEHETFGWGYAELLIESPIEESIASFDGDDLNTRLTSYGLALAAASRCACSAAQEARSLVDALIAYDHRTWPETHARRSHAGPGPWRYAVDAAVAQRVIAGDDTALESHLRSLEHVSEQLVPFLEALVAQTVDANTAARLHLVWARILDHLLPDARDLAPRPGVTERQPQRHQVTALDEALLLMPEASTISFWPQVETYRLGHRWLDAYTGRPDVADRAILFLIRMGEVPTPESTSTILRILGTDTEAMSASRLRYGWLRKVLESGLDDPATRAARFLLDQLAAAGSAGALKLQAELED